MDQTHLIVGNSDDYHAVAVKWCLNQLQQDVLIWDGIGAEDGARISIVPSTPDNAIRLGSSVFNSFPSVWYRRVVRFKKFKNVMEHTKSFLERELRESHSSLVAMIDDAAKFIVCGHGMHAAYSKALQLKLAKKMGFLVPETLISNDYDQVKSFVNAHKNVVVKHFVPHYWNSETSKTTRIVSTTILDDIFRVPQSSVEVCPSIYQQLIQKKYEMRVTVIGEKIFTAKIEKVGGGSFLDWRMNFGTKDFKISPFELNNSLSGAIVKYVRALGLHYGCLDLVVDKDNNVWFLEVNPTGQFLFVEQEIPEYKILRQFSEMLISGSYAQRGGSTADLSTSAFEASETYREFRKQAGALETGQNLLTELA